MVCGGGGGGGGGNNTDFLGECVYFLNYVYLLKQQSILEMSVCSFVN